MIENITLGEVLAFLTFIGGICAAISYALKPVKSLEDRLKKIEGRLDKIDEHLESDNRRIKKFEEDVKVIFRNQLLVMDHDIYDNHIEELKIAREETKEYIIKR